LALGLVLIAVWRWIVLKLEDNHHKKHGPGAKPALCHLALHYYTPLYLGMLYFTVAGIMNMMGLIGPIGYLLDAEAVKDQFRSDSPEAVGPEANWYPEIKYVEEEKWVVWLALTSPLWLVLTFIFSGYHTLTHVKQVFKHGTGRISKHILHDKAIQIIALPTMYALMSFKSVCRMLQVTINDRTGALALVTDDEGHHTWAGRKEFLSTLYEANFSVADLYEAWALYHFAMLAIKVISDFGDAESTRLEEKGKKNEPGGITEEVHKMSNNLAGGIHELTAQGIYGFVTVCILQSAFNLGMTGPEFYGWISAEQAVHLKEKAAAAGLKYALKGAGLLASSMAITNVVTVEVSFHDWLHEFSPASKFWSTKVLVSLAFFQSLILAIPPFSSLSVTGQNLFYASLLVAECFGVSLLHVYAWPADEKWYMKDADGEAAEARKKKGKDYVPDKQKIRDSQTAQKTTVSPYVRGREPETPYIQLMA